VVPAFSSPLTSFIGRPVAGRKKKERTEGEPPPSIRFAKNALTAQDNAHAAIVNMNLRGNLA
jgi:hypothetical protein